jgi:1,4-alpha-glucan branching enzyme
MLFRPPTDSDWAGWADGTHDAAFEVFGAHPTGGGRWEFRVWAPRAHTVSVVGDFNGWDPGATPMHPGAGGVWAGAAAAAPGARYK